MYTLNRISSNHQIGIFVLSLSDPCLNLFNIISLMLAFANKYNSVPPMFISNLNYSTIRFYSGMLYKKNFSHLTIDSLKFFIDLLFRYRISKAKFQIRM